VDSIFGTEELARYSDIIHQVEGEPGLCMHPDDATRLGLAEGDPVAVTLDAGTLEVKVSLSVNMAPWTLVMPHHRRLEWQKVKGFSIMIATDKIKKV
jgi:anaerobic selenocysteine-containing dehydrogenase